MIIDPFGDCQSGTPCTGPTCSAAGQLGAAGCIRIKRLTATNVGDATVANCVAQLAVTPFDQLAWGEGATWSSVTVPGYFADHPFQFGPDAINYIPDPGTPYIAAMISSDATNQVGQLSAVKSLIIPTAGPYALLHINAKLPLGNGLDFDHATITEGLSDGKTAILVIPPDVSPTFQWVYFIANCTLAAYQLINPNATKA